MWAFKHLGIWHLKQSTGCPRGAPWVSCSNKWCLMRTFLKSRSSVLSCHLVLLKHLFMLKENIQLFKYIIITYKAWDIGLEAQILLLLIL